MNHVAKEISNYMGSAKMTDEEFLEHYGMPRRSGRYPYGSGKDPHQHTPDFLSRVEDLKKHGWKETTENIKKDFNMTSNEFRMEKSICNNQRRMLKVARAKSLSEDGLKPTAIGKIMGIPESSVRSLLNSKSESKMNECFKTAEYLKKQVDKKGMVDVGIDVEKELGVSRERLDTALYLLEKEGYHQYPGRIPQLTNKNQQTTQLVLATPEHQHKDIYDYEKVKTITDYVSKDNGDTYEKKFTYPTSMDSKRLAIRYAEDGGKLKDGLVEIRKGCDDLSLGDSLYSQVRILVDNKKYIKGMAVYSDDLPKGVDVMFNTNKSKSVSKMDVLKDIKNDPDNPFGSNIKDCEVGGQYWYRDKNGKKKLGLINKRSDEGDWSDWKDALPSQFLSKQSKQLAKKQLNLAKANKEDEFSEIMSLTNPTLKKYYLKKFADGCDKAAVELKAAALPGQKYHVILPVNELGDKKVYAPQYESGTKLALIRYPHGGQFEIPILTVDNKNIVARKMIGTNAGDAIAISAKVAERLSGADFDGDTVMCIPTHDSKGKIKIDSRPPLKGLENFDNKLEYGPDPKQTYTDKKGVTHYCRAGHEYHVMKNKDNEMGKISNLITDMTLAGADDNELARAVRHSMVVIDAPKHKLDYKQSYIDNGIDSLKRKYQPKFDSNGNVIGGGGAHTIISKAKGETTILKRKGEPWINKKGKPYYDPTKPEGAYLYKTAKGTDLYYVDAKYDDKTHKRVIKTADGGSIEYDVTNESERKKWTPKAIVDSKTGDVTYTNGNGTVKYKKKARTQNISRMESVDDAYDLVSRRKHQMEILYADYANSLKSMANKARKEMVYTDDIHKNKRAEKIYAKEVSSLMSRLNDTEKNSIKEREVLRRTNSEIMKRQRTDPDLKGKEVTKLAQRLETKYREQVGAISRKKRALTISDKEWEAIQAGALSKTQFEKILRYSDPDSLRQRAMPKKMNSLSAAQINRIKAMSVSNYTLNEIANKMHLSPSTISKYLKGER